MERTYDYETGKELADERYGIVNTFPASFYP